MDDGTFEILDPGPRVPRRVPGIVRSCEDVYAALDAAAAELFLRAGQAVGEHGEFQLAVSASGLTLRLIRLLLIDPAMRDFPWVKTTVWVAEDEGAEPLADLLLDHSGIERANFHAVGPTTAGELAAKFGDRVLGRAAAARLDASVLGLDGGWMTDSARVDAADVYCVQGDRAWMGGRHLLGAGSVCVICSGRHVLAPFETGAPRGGVLEIGRMAAARTMWFLGAEGEASS